LLFFSFQPSVTQSKYSTCIIILLAVVHVVMPLVLRN